MQAAKIREIKGKLPGLQGLICAAGGKAGGFERVAGRAGGGRAEYGKAHPAAHAARVAAIPSEAPATFIYTSGTTGHPKGVILTHEQLVYEATRSREMGVIRADDVILLFLPMAHSFAKVLEAAWFATGATWPSSRRWRRSWTTSARCGPP